MKNTSSLFLTLVSYLIMLATIVFLLFAVLPSSLKAQTNAAVTNFVAQSAVVMPPSTPSPAPVVDVPGIHIGGVNSPEGETFTRALALMIPIVGIVMGCGIPIVIVGLQLYFRHRKNVALHETLRTMVEKSVPIPPEMFKTAGNESMDGSRAKRPRRDFRNGLLFIGVGLGTLIVYGKLGWILLFLGAAFLAASMFEKKSDDQQPPKP